MKVCGLQIKASEAILVIVEEVAGAPALVACKTKRLVLKNHEDGAELESFLQAAKSFLHENAIEIIAVKKRAGSGAMASSGVTFKIETLFQLAHKNIAFISPQAIKSFSKSNAGGIPYGVAAYQKDAYLSAGCCLKSAGLI
ncbi:DUF3010 family protein [Ensifer sp. OV372]|uniref:DUF3010 family protein n=1 Tax=Ensifer sp. OV372 TaxID=1855293 RepID=UPI0015A58094|nr:DUF3010 family protein [Ensifer sp. OV372]